LTQFSVKIRGVLSRADSTASFRESLNHNKNQLQFLWKGWGATRGEREDEVRGTPNALSIQTEKWLQERRASPQCSTGTGVLVHRSQPCGGGCKGTPHMLIRQRRGAARRRWHSSCSRALSFWLCVRMTRKTVSSKQSQRCAQAAGLVLLCVPPMHLLQTTLRPPAIC